MTDLTAAGLVEIAAHIRDRAVSSVEVTQALLTRIDQWQPAINAFVRIDRQRALDAARKADEELARHGPRGPLHGVPLAHKDMFDSPGDIVTCGSPLHKETRAVGHATVLRRLESAGAITLGALNMSEFAYDPAGTNKLSGATRNPWQPEYISGGSSSGPAAAVAAQLCFGALGSDTGGSIRLPSAICGVVGLKPTFGRVTLHGTMPLSFSLDCVGPLARSVRDAARMLAIIAGPDPRDASASAEPVADYESACDASPEGIRIGLPEEYFWNHVEAGLAQKMEGALHQVSRAGHAVEPLHIPDLSPVVAAANILIGAESAALHRRALAEQPDAFSTAVRTRIENGLAYTAQDYIDALKYRATALTLFMAAMEHVDVLIAPCLGIKTPTIAEIEDSSPATVSHRAALLSYWTRPINFLGLPAISVPCGFGPDGLPVGLQLIGKPFKEFDLLRAAHMMEGLLSGFQKAPALPNPPHSSANWANGHP